MSLESKANDEIDAAADLIQTLDSVRAKATSSIVTAAKESEEARNSAKWASTLVKRLQSKASIPNGEWEKLVLTETVDVPSENAAPRDDNRLQQIHHAEEVLALTLRLEQSQQALERLQMTQDETQLALSRAQAKNKLLENKIESLESRLQQTPDTALLEKELAIAKIRVEAAEEDAEMALDLAKANSESREQIEGFLHRALEELEHYRGGGSPTKSVHFAESPTVVEIKPETSRALVNKGRSLLEQTKEPSPSESSVERRKKLRELMKLDLEPTFALPKSPTVSHTKSAQRIQESGRKLNLTGRYWTEDTDLDTLVRHYCTAVEVTIERQQKDIHELESLCTIWEKGNQK